MKHLPVLIILAALALVGCGTPAPPAPTVSAVEQRQTSAALSERPTLAPVPTTPPPTPRPFPQVLATSADDPRAMGDPNAPVTIYEFTDYECPFCKQFYAETRAQLITEYVETGKVRLVARDFPLEIHASAMLAAVAGHCAAAQQNFWPMYETLFETHQVEWGGVPKRDRETLIDLATQIGIEPVAFTACLDDPATEQAVQAEMQAAMQLGINSTPNFMVNGTLLRGSLPIGSFRQLIDSLLAE
ncbi:DSBA oxidoreductase [Oscillochloris trichoides DG-6]|uniref:DSBA oxidoreductase n=1 Tax=Oscillochloris trichoides DG-6 TaxID=765420 RepID=E1IC44_9CHLR|nr:thioredoxin domain-containing protein [Oscillochloris trichoides]EFO81234.1 DSBA oxidoreductase [Oscillochloris trichoides DG-6]